MHAYRLITLLPRMISRHFHPDTYRATKEQEALHRRRSVPAVLTFVKCLVKQEIMFAGNRHLHLSLSSVEPTLPHHDE